MNSGSPRFKNPTIRNGGGNRSYRAGFGRFSLWPLSALWPFVFRNLIAPPRHWVPGHFVPNRPRFRRTQVTSSIVMGFGTNETRFCSRPKAKSVWKLLSVIVKIADGGLGLTPQAVLAQRLAARGRGGPRSPHISLRSRYPNQQRRSARSARGPTTAGHFRFAVPRQFTFHFGGPDRIPVEARLERSCSTWSPC